MGLTLIRAGLAFLTLLFTVILGRIAKETGWAVYVEELLDAIAHALGREKPVLMGLLAPFVLAAPFAFGLVYAAYRLGKWERAQKSPLQILFDENDSRFVRRDEKRETTWYSIGIWNDGPKTLLQPELRAQESEFTERAIAPSAMGYTPHSALPKEPVIYLGQELHPKTSEIVDLFGFPDIKWTAEDSFLRQSYIFSFEARATDSMPVVARFKYDPSTSPTIKRIT